MDIFFDIVPQISHGRFVAKILINDYSVGGSLTFKMQARRSDGLMVTKSIQLGTPDRDYGKDIEVYFFDLSYGTYGQIVACTVNKNPFFITYQNVADITPTYHFRFDDSVLSRKYADNLNNIKLDFHVISIGEPKKLIIADDSEWGQLSYRDSYIEITIPGFREPITHFLEKNKINTFNSISLGTSCIKDDCTPELQNLPDGVYLIKILGNPSSYNCEKSYLKTDNIRTKIDKLYAKVALMCDDIDDILMENIKKAEFMLASAEAANRQGQYKMGHDFLFYANQIIDSFGNCNNCNTNCKIDKN